MDVFIDFIYPEPSSRRSTLVHLLRSTPLTHPVITETVVLAYKGPIYRLLQKEYATTIKLVIIGTILLSTYVRANNVHRYQALDAHDFYRSTNMV